MREIKLINQQTSRESHQKTRKPPGSISFGD
jgi:hypothetical protein